MRQKIRCHAEVNWTSHKPSRTPSLSSISLDSDWFPSPGVCTLDQGVIAEGQDPLPFVTDPAHTHIYISPTAAATAFNYNCRVGSCGINHITCAVWNIYYLGLYRKGLQTPGLCLCKIWILKSRLKMPFSISSLPGRVKYELYHTDHYPTKSEAQYHQKSYLGISVTDHVVILVIL